MLIKGCREKYDEFNKKYSFTLNNKTSIEYSTHDIPYGNVAGAIKKFNTSIDLADVLLLSVDEIVNVIAYAECDGAEKTAITTRYGPKQKKTYYYMTTQQIGPSSYRYGANIPNQF